MTEFVDLEGRKYKISLSKYTNQHNNKSDLHLKARKLLHDIFPFDSICEELTIHVGRGQTLFADFYLISRRLMIEVHGEQHFKHVQFFHKNKSQFRLAKARDANKAEWCKVNNIRLVILAFDNQDEWEDLIYGRIQNI